MQLSKRLMSIAEMVTKGNRLVDIGTDHGYLPIYLVQNQIVPHALAMDVHRGPLLRADAHIAAERCTGLIETRLSDGFEKYRQGEGDTVVIAGMGGALTVHILDEGRDKREGIQELILSPQSEIFLVREYLQQEKYRIIKEKMVKDEGKFYTIIKAVPGQDDAAYESYQMRYGYIMLRDKDEVLKEYLCHQKTIFSDIIRSLSAEPSETAQKRVQELSQELSDIEAALQLYQ